MPIAPPVTPIATTVKSTTIILKRWIANEDPAGESANYQIVLLDQGGNRYRWRHEQGNIIPHWTSELVTMAQVLMDASWALAEGVLPE